MIFCTKSGIFLRGSSLRIKYGSAVEKRDDNIFFMDKMFPFFSNARYINWTNDLFVSQRNFTVESKNFQSHSFLHVQFSQMWPQKCLYHVHGKSLNMWSLVSETVRAFNSTVNVCNRCILGERLSFFPYSMHHMKCCSLWESKRQINI